MTRLIKRFLSNESGATAIEYGLIAAFIGIGIIVSVTSVRDNFGNVTNNVGNGLQGR